MNQERIGQIPVAWIEPSAPVKRKVLAIWITGFSGSKEGVEGQLKQLADRGYYALSFDPWHHGERRIEPNPELLARVRGNIRRWFWPILAFSAEEVPTIVDWAIHHLGVQEDACMGGVSMGGDIAVAAGSVEPRLKAIVGVVATPDWMRPGSFEPPGEPDNFAQECYDRRNPLTHIELYGHKPAISFQSGAIDRQVPPDGGQRFVRLLQGIYQDCPERLEVFLHPNQPHGFAPAMMENSIRWFERWVPAR